MKKLYIDWELEWKFHVKCRGLRIVAYRAVQVTDDDGVKLEKPKTIAYTDDLSKKEQIEAFISEQRSFKKKWVVFAYEYNCGHVV